MESQRKYPGFWAAVLLCALFLGFQSGLAVPLVVLELVFHVKVFGHPAVLCGLNTLAGGLTLAVGFLLGRQPWRQTMPLQPVRWAVLAAVLVTMLGAAILLSEADNLLRMILPMPAWVVAMFKLAFGLGGSFWGSLMLLVIVAPVSEELLCRGLILRGFLSRFGPRKAILLSALLFAGLHLNPWQFVSAFALGGLLGWWLLRTGSLVPCLAGHAIYNGCVLAAPYLPWKIPGFNRGDALAPEGFQPWWFDLLGGVLVAIGVLWFRKAAPPRPVAASGTPHALPPVLTGLEFAARPAPGGPPVIPRP